MLQAIHPMSLVAPRPTPRLVVETPWRAAVFPSRIACSHPKMTVVIARTAEDLGPHVPAWEQLAAAAMEPNVFYEPWMLLPALRCFGSADMQVAMVYASDPSTPTRAPVLCGLFPFQRDTRYAGVPIACLRLWKYIHCYLCTPLMRAENAQGCLEALFAWLARDRSGTPLVEFRSIAGEGPVHQALVDDLRRHQRPTHANEWHTRALLRRASDAETYLRSAVSGEGLRAQRRRARRLAELGQVECLPLDADSNVQRWVDQFLQLESQGWKGRDGGALACKPEEQAFFISVATEAFRRRRLLALSLNMDGRPIASRCSFLAGDGAFSFKSAFDERYAHHSPGVQLELENIRQVHATPQIQWMDSCTQPDNAMINRLWKDRRTIQSLVVATGRSPGDLFVSLMPLLRWLRRATPLRTLANRVNATLLTHWRSHDQQPTVGRSVAGGCRNIGDAAAKSSGS